MGLRDTVYDFFFEKDDESTSSNAPGTNNTPGQASSSVPSPIKIPKSITGSTESIRKNVPTSKGSSWFTIKEYKRTCLQCGTVWHSLKSRETDLKLSSLQGAIGSCQGSIQQCQTCGMCGGTRQATGQRNHDASTSELNRLKSCPRCRSHNYSEAILEFNNRIK